MSPKIAKAIYDLRDVDKFKDYFEKVATSQQCEKVRDGLREFHFDATNDNCFDVSGKLLSKIFEFRSKRKNDVKPLDIEEQSFVQNTDIVFLQEVGNKCPLCNRKLIITKNGKKLPQYRIMSIYPKIIEPKDANKFDAIKKAFMDEVENFHLKLSKILDREIKEALNELRDQLGLVDQTIQTLESKVKKVSSTPSVDMLLVEKISRYDSEIQNLQKANDLYDEKKQINGEKKRVNSVGIRRWKKN